MKGYFVGAIFLLLSAVVAATISNELEHREPEKTEFIEYHFIPKEETEVVEDESMLVSSVTPSTNLSEDYFVYTSVFNKTINETMYLPNIPISAEEPSFQENSTDVHKNPTNKFDFFDNIFRPQNDPKVLILHIFYAVVCVFTLLFIITQMIRLYRKYLRRRASAPVTDIALRSIGRTQVRQPLGTHTSIHCVSCSQPLLPTVTSETSGTAETAF